MNQKIAEWISRTLLNWRRGDPFATLYFPFPPTPKESVGAGYRKRLRTKDFETKILEVCQEQIEVPYKGKHLGCRLIFVVRKRNVDLDNCIKSIWDGCKTIAFADDKLFDYVECLRIQAESAQEEQIVMELFEMGIIKAGWI